MFEENHLPERIKWLQLWAKLNSDDHDTKVACCLVNIYGNVTIVNANSFVNGCDKRVLPNSGPAKYEYILHAEQQMIYECAKLGVPTDRGIVICTLSPCVICGRALLQSGINIVYYKKVYKHNKLNMIFEDITMKSSRVIVGKDKFWKMEISPNKGE